VFKKLLRALKGEALKAIFRAIRKVLGGKNAKKDGKVS
jgi:hypothetical protein